MHRRARIVSTTLMLSLVPACSQTGTSPPASEQSGRPVAGPPDRAQDDPTGAPLPDRDPALAHRLVEQGALLLDVRTPQEFAKGHIEGAVNIPHDRVADQIERIGELAGGDKGKPIVVYCRSGRRSGLAKHTLTEHGYGRVTNLGGMSDW